MAIAIIRELPRDESNSNDMPMIGNSRAMCEVKRLIKQVAPSDANVLIYGETGTGKELVAHALHKASKRSRQPFVVIDCTSLPSELIETELFGHEEGAFTGAIKRREGKFGQAHGGTVFLDEISNLPLKDQAKLLGVIQRREFSRVGGNGTIKVDVRIIAATNKPLNDMIKVGTFREDLFYRLNVVNIDLPALRDRREDIPELVEYFLQKHACHFSPMYVTPSVMAALMFRDWPGNVRELEHEIERLCVMTTSDIIESYGIDAGSMKDLYCKVVDNMFYDAIGDVEQGYILRMLEKYGWNQTLTAKMMGIPRTSLRLKMKRYRIACKGLALRRQQRRKKSEMNQSR